MVRWDSKSKDAKKLQGMFQKGMIASDATPKMILDSVQEWKDKYTTSQFRNAFNRYKNEFSNNVSGTRTASTGKVNCYFYL